MEKVSSDSSQPNEDCILDHNIYVNEKNTNTNELLLDIEKLNRVNVDNIVESASHALSQLKQSGRAPNSLAESHGKIVSIVYDQIRKNGINSLDLISKTLDSIRRGIEKNGIKYDFLHEDAFEQFGPSRARGVYADVEYLLSAEKAPYGSRRKHYTNAILDNKYSIDYITTTLSEESFEVDLVQVKSGGVALEKRDVDKIIQKHQMFIERYDLVFEELKVKEIGELELESFRKEFAESELDTKDALTLCIEYFSLGEEEAALSDFIHQLDTFKNTIISSDSYHKGMNSAKYTYISNLINILGMNVHNADNNAFINIYNEWKNTWLGEIKIKKEKILHKIDNPKFNIVTYNSETKEKEVYSIKSMSIDSKW